MAFYHFLHRFHLFRESYSFGGCILLKREYRLTNPASFKSVYQKGKSLAGRYVVLYYKKNHLGKNRYGFVVSKKIGKAVVRNRIKRLLREVCRQKEKSQLQKGYDLIFIARGKIKGISYSLVEQEIDNICRKAGLFK